MAYVTYYNIKFDNHLNEGLLINIERKDGAPETVPETIYCTEFETHHEGDGQNLFDTPILRRNMSVTVNLQPSDSVTWNTFFDQVHDEWRITATNDNMHVFSGFMLPDQGNVPFRDKPYDLTIRGADGLALLKNVALKKADGTNFHGKFTLIEYVSACLFWTGLELPIKIYCDLFESSMDDRGVAIANDMFNQAKLDHRTFMKDAVEFVSCFEALEIIFKEHFRIYQDYDRETNQQVWAIDRIPQYQYTPAPIVYYTLYDFDGTNPVGYEDPENYSKVGKIELQYKTNDVSKSGKFAVKKTRTTYNYKVWPEIPLNNKFERGDLLLPYSGVNYRAYEIDDWEFGITSAQVGTSSWDYPFTLVATTKRAYRKSTYNIYGIELDREIIIENPTTANRSNWLRSEGIPVNAGDKIKISFDVRYLINITSLPIHTSNPARVYIVGDDSNIYGLSFDADAGIGEWIITAISSGNTPIGAVGKDFNNVDSKQYNPVSVDAPLIPANGTLYIVLDHSSNQNYGSQVMFRNFHLEYHPFVAGGYIEVKGDYWERSQNANYIDVTDNEVKISDVITRVLKGCIFRENGITATTPTWYRYGLSESKHYKELINIGRYNSEYRRFMKFQGTFTGTKSTPENDPTSLRPISFHTIYRFMDVPGEPECVLVAPLTIDYKTGWITAIFEEVRRESATPITETLEDLMLRIVHAINSTSEAEWDSAGGAPASGTVAFPPFAIVYPYQPNQILVQLGIADNMTATYTIGSAGNVPYVMETYNAPVTTTNRWIIFEIGADIAIGNTFIFEAYGHEVAVTVQATVNGSQDGRQLGDSSTFNYLFE